MAVHMDVVVVGAGQAGLAMGYYLARQGRRFIILDRAPAVGHSWRSRYDSLKLFTPAQYNGLPGLPFPGPADRYPTKDEVADYLQAYVETFALPVKLNTAVTRIRPGYVVETDAGAYTADQVVIASGPFQRPFVPPFSKNLDPQVFQMHSTEYQRPDQVPPGPVLVVGAGNSGAQIAEELVRNRRQVSLSAGNLPPYMPQRFLGRDLFWWLHTLGLMRAKVGTWLGERMRRNDPLIGTDLRHLTRDLGVDLLGRAESASGTTVAFASGRTLPVRNVIWATGFVPDYEWIEVPVFDDRGLPAHRRGVTAAPGFYFLGLPWQHTRGSALLGGVGADAEYLSAVMTAAVESRTSTGPETPGHLAG